MQCTVDARVDRARQPCQCCSMRFLTGLVGTALILSACGSGEASACGDSEFEALDPKSAIHIISEEGITFQSDPPTSGPHASGAIPDGTLEAPIAPSLQVAILERGDIIVHFDPELVSADEVATVSRQGVVSIPTEGLDAAVVVTAWQQRMTCTGWHATEVEAFRANNGGETAGHS